MKNDMKRHEIKDPTIAEMHSNRPEVFPDGSWKCETCGRILGSGVGGCSRCYKEEFGEDPPREWLFF